MSFSINASVVILSVIMLKVSYKTFLLNVVAPTTYLPWPPWAVQQNKNDPICVVPLKVAKASAVVTVACCCR
jgi:hypothetical protein